MGAPKTHQTICRSAGRITAQLLLSFLAISPATAAWTGGAQAPLVPDQPETPVPGEHDFTLRHIFHRGTYRYPNLHQRLDIRSDDVAASELNGVKRDEFHGIGPFRTRSNPITIQRLAKRRIEDVQLLLSAARMNGRPPALPVSAWVTEKVPAPDITDRETVINLALMAANAYDEIPYIGEWENVTQGFNLSDSFGWEGDGLRGHIFADRHNSSIVIAMKGTSSAVFDGQDTTTNDKENDNLFFGCCCGQGGNILWRQSCDCQTSAYTCNNTCVSQALRQENRYYQSALELYGNVTELYPHSQVFLTGHSLGGAVASLLGLTIGMPAITFEAPGQALAASRLGLPLPPGSHIDGAQTRINTGGYHFGHTADPVFMGTCNGVTDGCSIAGYAMQTQCHTGLECIYDVVADKRWRVSLTTHSIRAAIRDVYRAYDDVAPCYPDVDCQDCFNWNFFESNGTERTTTTTTSMTSTSSSTTSYTRTQTCLDPGWWGCNDPITTTTTTSSTSSTTSPTTTVTCTHYGWFGGCLDKTTTTSHTATTTTTTTSLTTTTTCTHYGFFGGCLDDDGLTATSTSPSPSITSTPIPSTTSAITTTTCLTPGRIYGCWDTTTPAAYIITAAPRL